MKAIVKRSRYLFLTYMLLVMQCVMGVESIDDSVEVMSRDTHIGIGQNFLKPISHLCTDQSAVYFDVQTHFTSIHQQIGWFSIGMGYRNLLMPRWMSGCYIAWNHLSDSVSNTDLVNIGIESISPWLQVKVNAYGAFDAGLAQKPTKEELYLSSRVKNAVDCKLAWTFFENITPFGGGYYMSTQAQTSLMGYAFGVQYRFTPHINFEFKRTVSSEHNYISLGFRFETGKVANHRADHSHYLWQPVDRHFAPLVVWPTRRIENIQKLIHSTSELNRSARSDRSRLFYGDSTSGGSSGFGPETPESTPPVSPVSRFPTGGGCWKSDAEDNDNQDSNSKPPGGSVKKRVEHFNTLQGPSRSGYPKQPSLSKVGTGEPSGSVLGLGIQVSNHSDILACPSQPLAAHQVPELGSRPVVELPGDPGRALSPQPNQNDHSSPDVTGIGGSQYRSSSGEPSGKNASNGEPQKNIPEDMASLFGE